MGRFLVPRLPGLDPPDEARDRASGARLLVRDGAGSVVWEITGFLFQVNERVPLAPGEYTVRLDVPGFPPREQKVSLGDGAGSVDFVITR